MALSFLRRVSAAIVVVVVAACGGSTSSPAIDAPAIVPGVNTTVVALDGEHVYFGDPNRRTVDVAVTFPAPALRYSRVTLRLGLRCPSPGGCDWWDRLGRLSVLLPP